MGDFDAMAEKRQELAARRLVMKRELTQLAGDIAAIDRAIRLVFPERAASAGPRGAEQRAGAPFGHGELTSAALDALRRLGPATSGACAAAMLKAKGIEADTALLAQTASRVSAVYSQKAAMGQVRRAGNGEGRQVMWELAA